MRTNKSVKRLNVVNDKSVGAVLSNGNTIKNDIKAVNIKPVTNSVLGDASPEIKPRSNITKPNNDLQDNNTVISDINTNTEISKEENEKKVVSKVVKSVISSNPVKLEINKVFEDKLTRFLSYSTTNEIVNLLSCSKSIRKLDIEYLKSLYEHKLKISEDTFASLKEVRL